MSGTEYWAKKCAEKEAENERLRAALFSIGILNASGGNYDIEIDKVIRQAASCDHRADKEQK